MTQNEAPPNTSEFEQEVDPASAPPDNSLAVARSRVELDGQIATARAYPRSLKKFLNDSMSMATLSMAVAEECFYALPRKERDPATGKKVTKMIEGPSVRLAEIVASAWGNARFGARVISEEAEFVIAQGVFHDLEKNTQITMEVRRRITTRDGRRYGADMIATTGNAACSIAMRNAVFRGVPKALWNDVYIASRTVAAGDAKTLASRRSEMFQWFLKRGATREGILETMGVKGEEEIGLEELATLKGIAAALRDGETTVEEAFPEPTPDDGAMPKPASGRGVAGLKAAAASKKGKADAEQPAAQAPPAAPETPPVQDPAQAEKPQPPPSGATEPPEKPASEESAELARECAQLVSQLGMSGDDVRTWLKDMGVSKFAKWRDLDDGTLLRVRGALKRQIANATPPATPPPREPGEDG